MTTFASQLIKKVQALNTSEREIFERIFRLKIEKGKIKPPSKMRSWIGGKFGNIKNVEEQEIVRIDNLITGEGSLFNELRGKRPLVEENKVELEKLIAQSRGDDFCNPKEKTPEDVFGRIEGRHSLTAANVAKYDRWHSIVIFKEHHPLTFSEERIRDYLEVANKWYEKVNSIDREALYPIFMWNCLWRASASIIHGHAQILLARDNHYLKVETLRKQSEAYQRSYNANYFDDLYTVHKSLGLAGELQGLRVLSYLTPVKNKELLIFAHEDLNLLAAVINKILKTYKENLSTQSFNLVILFPPLRETKESWEHFPVLVRLLDRGDSSKKTSDIGGGELFYQSVVEDSPYMVASSFGFFKD